jgi:hypothetical protein
MRTVNQPDIDDGRTHAASSNATSELVLLPKSAVCRATLIPPLCIEGYAKADIPNLSGLALILADGYSRNVVMRYVQWWRNGDDHHHKSEEYGRLLRPIRH